MEYNKIYNGDCALLLQNVSLFESGSVNLVVTSPPYADKRMDTYGGIHPDKYVEWFLPISDQIFRVLKDDGSFILNIKEHPKDGERNTYVLELILALKSRGWFWIEEYCWYKKNCFPGKWPNRFRDSWERCLHFTKNKKFKMKQEEVMVPIGDWASKRFKSMSEDDFIRRISKNNNHFARNVSNWLNKKKVYPHNVIVFEEEHRLFLSNVVELATESSSLKNHSALFPIELPSWFITLFTDENDVILDPFMGSGTSAVSAKLLRRKYLGIEAVKSYVESSEILLKEIEEDIFAKP